MCEVTGLHGLSSISFNSLISLLALCTYGSRLPTSLLIVSPIFSLGFDSGQGVSVFVLKHDHFTC